MQTTGNSRWMGKKQTNKQTKELLKDLTIKVLRNERRKPTELIRSKNQAGTIQKKKSGGSRRKQTT